MSSEFDLENEAKSELLVGISSCLLGEKVRYDGGHKLHSYITETLGTFFRFRAFCPEMDIGLGVPRETIKLVKFDTTIRCVGAKNSALDVTDSLVASAEAQRNSHQELCAYIFKKGSPSCGPTGVKLYGLDADNPENFELKGMGVFVKTLSENFPQLPIEDEERLGDPVLRENFIQRIFVYHHWQIIQDKGFNINELRSFHRQYELTLMSHEDARTLRLSKQLTKRLSKQPDSSISGSMDSLSQWYFSEMMQILSIVATRKNHYKVLETLHAYLAEFLLKRHNEELLETFSAYLKGQLPLVVPLTLLAHHFRDHLDLSIDLEISQRIRNSKYVFPDLLELSCPF